MATFDYNRTNLGAASLSSPITAAATTATVGASAAAAFPTAPFYATIMPVGKTPNQLNSEIVQVTANNSGALGLVRAQRGTTAKAFDAGALVMNGVYIQDLEQAQAVGKSFFSATLTSGVYYINDSRVPTTPADGDSIRVVFGSNWTSGTPKLSLNSGTSHSIYAGNNLTSGNASTTTNAMVKSGVIYELTYYNGNWYVLNLVANNSITSDNMDWTTMDGLGVWYLTMGTGEGTVPAAWATVDLGIVSSNITLSAGQYFATYYVAIGCSSQGGLNGYQLRVSGADSSENYDGGVQYSNYQVPASPATAMFTLNSEKTINFSAVGWGQIAGAKISLSNGRILIQKLA